MSQIQHKSWCSSKTAGQTATYLSIALAVICVSSLFLLSCKDRKPLARNLEKENIFSTEAALNRVAQLTGRRTVDPWFLAGQDYALETNGRSDSARRGRDLWFLATGGNASYIHKVLATKLGSRIDWHKFIGSKTRGQRFSEWGGITDPDCHPPRNDLEEAVSYGWDVCPGDIGEEGLFTFVGRPAADWETRDPACKFRESDATDRESRGSPCSLAFGTSTGVIGWRKFPNPKFRSDRWKGWDEYQASDLSVEPPFLIGASCAACHAGYDPEHPPLSQEAPKWENVLGLVGNRFLRIGSLIGSGLEHDQASKIYLEHLRPGVVHHLTDFGPVVKTAIPPPHAIPQGVAVLFEGSEDKKKRMQIALRNSGVCAESCFVTADGFDESCRSQCQAWNAFQTRIDDMQHYADSIMAPELSRALGISRSDLIATRISGGLQTYEKGRLAFARHCGTCHSGTTDPSRQPDWAMNDPATRDIFERNRDGQRIDILSDGGITSAATLGLNKCLGTGEMYRNSSLLGLWARAPFLSTRALGAVQCDKVPGSPATCQKAEMDTSLEGRLLRFERAINQFLSIESAPVPAGGLLKTIEVEMGPRSYNGDALALLFPDFSDLSPNYATVSKNIHSAKIFVQEGSPVPLLRNIDGQRWLDSLANKSQKVKPFEAVLNITPDGEISSPWIRCKDVNEAKGHERYIPNAQDEREALKAFLLML